MTYWVTLFWRALGETWELTVGGGPLNALVTILVFVATVILVRRRRGPDAMRDEVRSAGIGVMASASVWLAMLLFHILVVSPKRWIAEENIGRAEAELEL
jgi:hypothetical protein